MGTAASSKVPDLTKVEKLTEIKFHLQDKEHTVNGDGIDANTTLNTYLRKHLYLTGTKAMCREGGCGTCVVAIHSRDPVTEKEVVLAMNSCLVPLLSCHGLRIYTIEGIGDPLRGYHPVQEILARFNGTQCGFCSPGMVMNMYALYESGHLTMQEIEDSFSGNICRCTGYRSILAAFKSLCKDANREIIGDYPDIEDLKICDRTRCEWECITPCDKKEKMPHYILMGTSKWIKVHSMRDLLTTLQTYQSTSYKFVAGNTARGVYTSYADPVDTYIEITSIPELTQYEFKGDSLVLGANMTLTSAIDLFRTIGQAHANFSYIKQMADHIDLVANLPVRNRGTLAGNLMIKHDHNEFPSDIFLLLETVGALISVVSFNGSQVWLRPSTFFKTDMKLRVVQSITLPEHSSSQKFLSYKIMPRAQNVHAFVNAGFLFEFYANGVIKRATIVFGNLSPNFVHATNSEKILVGNKLFDNSTLQLVLATLSQELQPVLMPPDPSPEFRKQLAIGLFYKAVLCLAPKVSPRNRSGGTLLQRPISKGAQDFETNASLYPLTQPVPKIEALAQTSGQAQYIEDMPDLPNQLFGALVLARVPPNSILRKVNVSKALQQEGVVAFYGKDDIPGDNNFTPLGLAFVTSEEEIFCGGRVLYYEQPIGILVGKKEDAVLYAASIVEITYDAPNVGPLLSVRQVLQAGRQDRIRPNRSYDPIRRGNDIKHVVRGTFDLYQQYHFHMETQCCNIIPTEDGLEIYASTQWMDLIQEAVAKMLGIESSKIIVTVRRCGGAFGAKISRTGLIACAGSLAAWKLRKPVKIALPLKTNMAVMGKRFPFSVDYEVGVNNSGVIQYLNSTLYTDVGAQVDEDITTLTSGVFRGNYNTDTFRMQMLWALTDTPVNTWTRAPGSTEGLASIESIMEHIAITLNMDPLALRMANFKRESPLPRYVNEIKAWADIDKRKQQIEIFNKQNRWKKKGLAVVPMTFEMILGGPYYAMVSILHGDGAVQISHGGVEIGQGINTKVAQVCAYKLGIPLQKVTVIPSYSFVAPNNLQTGASLTSEAICYGVIQACDQLLARIEPVRIKMGNPTWEALIQQCFALYIDLTARGLYTPNAPNVRTYDIYGVCASEVLLDVLTGQYILTRVDLLEDAGQSMSPVIDIGQIEGAFVMGMGYYTSEQIVYNYEGKLLTNNTWTYYPPGAKDIPVNFNVKIERNNPNPVGILKSKATGEPATTLAVSIPLAVRHALASARTDADPSISKWYPFEGPTTVENVLMNSLNHYTQYTL